MTVSYLALFVYFTVKIALAKITIPLERSLNNERAIQAAVEIANSNFNWRELTVFLSKDVDGSLDDLFLKEYRGTVVVQTKRDDPSPGHVVVIVQSFHSFMKILSLLKPDLKGKTLLGSGATFLIILLQNTDKIQSITKILWSYRAVKAIILTDENNKTALYTYYPFKNLRDCQNTEPRLIGYWTKSLKKSKELYTDKMKDMKGCPIYVSTNKLYHPSTEKKIPLQIVKKSMMRLLENIMNFTPITSTNDYVSIDSNRAKNWSDSLNDVINGVANISTCSIPLGIDRQGLLDYSMPYFRVRLAWLAPPITVGSVWWRLLSPLNGYLWLVLLVLLFFITSLPYALKLNPVKKFCVRHFKNIDRLQSVTIRIWGVLLGQPINVAPRRFRDFYILSLWIWFTFVIRSAYQSVLIGALKTDILIGAFADLKEAMDEGYEIGGRAGIYAFFEHDPHISDHFRIVEEEDFEATFRDVVERKRKFVLATSLEYAWAYCLSKGNKDLECGYILPDSIMTVPLAIWMKAHSPFKRILTVWIPRLLETGLLHRDLAIKPISLLTKSSDPTPITMHQALSCMLCLFLGYSVSAIVLLLEILKHKMNKMNLKPKVEMSLIYRNRYPYQN